MAFSRLFTFFTAIVLATTALSALLDAAAFANTSFDFIIVGGGTAGVAVAVRLIFYLKYVEILIDVHKPGRDCAFYCWYH